MTSPLPVGQSEAFFSGSDLPPADIIADFPEDNPPDLGPDTPPSSTGGDKLCGTCGEPIYREPGTRGRLPNYHPACRPSTLGTGSRRSFGTTSKAANKAEREADLIAQLVRKNMAKGALLLSMVDPFDGFAVMAGTKDVTNNVRAVMVQHDAWRTELLKMHNGGSMAGLIAAVLAIALPIAAHHGLVPAKRISDILEAAPKAMFQLSQKMETAEADLAAKMNEAAAEAPPPPSAQAA